MVRLNEFSSNETDVAQAATIIYLEKKTRKTSKRIQDQEQKQDIGVAENGKTSRIYR